MKTSLALALALLPALLGAETRNVFIIGHSAVNLYLPAFLNALANDHPEVEHFHQIDMGIGAPLRGHWMSPTTGQMKNGASGADARRDLLTGNYDALVLTEGLPVRNFAIVGISHDYAGRYVDMAAAAHPGVRTYLFENWPCLDSGSLPCSYDADDAIPWRSRIESDQVIWQGIPDHVNGLHAGNPMRIIPGGRGLGRLADAIGQGGVPGIATIAEIYAADRYHLSDAGNYFMACLFFATIYQRSPVGLTNNTPGPGGGPSLGPPAATAQRLQEIAWETVCNDPRTGVSCAAPAANAPLGALSGLTATALSTASIRLAWSGTAGAGNGVRIERSPDGISFSQVGFAGAAATEFTDTGLAAGASYWYRVAAYAKGGGTGPDSNVASAATMAAGSDLILPAAPSNVTVTPLSPNRARVAFTDNAANERWHVIERSADGGVTFTTITYLAAGKTVFENGGLLPSTNYVYRISAENAGGISAAASGSGTTMGAGSPPPAPATFTAFALSSHTVALAFSSNFLGGRTGYKVERSFNGFTYNQIYIVGAGASSLVTSAGLNDDAPLQPDTVYYYRIRATGGNGDSAYVSTQVVTLPAGAARPSYVPLTEASGPAYLGQFPLGLYTGGNAIPAAHAAAGAAFAAQVVPRNGAGDPDPAGKIVVMSVGMSNNFNEFCNSADETACAPGTFIQRAFADPTLSLGPAVPSASVYVVNGASPTQAASTWESPSSPNYSRIQDKLTDLNLSTSQVQVVWLKNADPQPSVSLPAVNADAYVYEQRTANVIRTLKTVYPNLKLVFLSSRIYAGYANTLLNPEPYAYEYGFSVKWLIDAQITQMDGGPTDVQSGNLNYNDGTAPWLAWGPYLWADGPNPNTDGISYLPGDMAADGTHPGPGGAIGKVGAALLNFFKTSPHTQPWFAPGAPPPPPPDAMPPARPRGLRLR